MQGGSSGQRAVSGHRAVSARQGEHGLGIGRRCAGGEPLGGYRAAGGGEAGLLVVVVVVVVGLGCCQEPLGCSFQTLFLLLQEDLGCSHISWGVTVKPQVFPGCRIDSDPQSQGSSLNGGCSPDLKSINLMWGGHP